MSKRVKYKRKRSQKDSVSETSLKVPICLGENCYLVARKMKKDQGTTKVGNVRKEKRLDGDRIRQIIMTFFTR